MRANIVGVVLAFNAFIATTASPVPPTSGVEVADNFRTKNLDIPTSSASDIDNILDAKEIFPSPTISRWAYANDPNLDPTEIRPSPTVKKHWARDLCHGSSVQDLCHLICTWTKMFGGSDCFPAEETIHVVNEYCGGEGMPKCEQ